MTARGHLEVKLVERKNKNSSGVSLSSLLSPMDPTSLSLLTWREKARVVMSLDFF